jgi:two-component system, cell cycle sensor histidine kinase and response regulator CckA
MSEQKGTQSGPANNAGPLIYVVDDEPLLLELAMLILAPQGFDIKTFRDPEQALEAFRRAEPRPDLVITDYAMISMNGMMLMNECRAIRPGQRVLLISGTVDELIFEDTVDRPDAFLAKPYKPRQLIGLVKELAGG